MIKVMSVPHLDGVRSGESGINTIIRKYYQHGRDYGIDFVPAKTDSFDVLAVHAGTAGNIPKTGPVVAHLHGLYFTADYHMGSWAYAANKTVIESIRRANVTTVPSEWVAEILQRDARLDPYILPHGIDVEDWTHDYQHEGHVIGYAKNRAGVDVCDPSFLPGFAKRFPDTRFVATFAPTSPSNVKVTGLLPHDVMKEMVQRAAVYISTTKETWGVGILEALASGTPVVAFDEGGASTLINHGINGYLARPGDYDDLDAGLRYCLQHRDDLSHWAKQSALHWSWDTAMRQLSAVYQLASLGTRSPTVTVVIPCYNKKDTLERAVKSALKQTHPHMQQIIIVNDGSTDGSGELADELDRRYEMVSVIHQANAGVANARNAGISEAVSKYIIPLDADDAIEPAFAETCADALESDWGLSIAYTRLRYIKGDESDISDWPADWKHDDQLKGRNQVPTCAMFKRGMWQRLGGYKQRYAPLGAGSEDAEFWLRAGSYGFKAQMVTREPLFIYTMGSGMTSRDDYREVDWREMHPYVRDQQHPIASYATPLRMSHPVRQYDQPEVSVIIPVGPGHVNKLVDALDSLEAQTFRRWEVVVVMDNDDNYDHLQKAYPYARFYSGIATKSMGAGWARNRGVERARANLLLFLDADDTLMPNCIERMVSVWNGMDKKAVVYSDYYGVAYVDDVSQLARNLQKNIVLRTGTKTVMRYKAGEFDCERAAQQPDGDHPYIWNNVTSLVHKQWHDRIGGFDETMDSWEDVDYWWRLAWNSICFVHIQEPLMVYRFYTGQRRDAGGTSRKHLVEYIAEKKRSFGDIMCGGCGKKRVGGSSPAQWSVNRTIATGEQVMNDESVVLVEYTHRNRGQHGVYGPVTRTFYGHRGGGEQFLVDRRDIEAAPNLFKPLNNTRKVEELPVEPRAEAPAPPPAEPVKKAKPKVQEDVLKKQVEAKRLDLQSIPGVSEAIAKQFRQRGLATAQDLIDYGAEQMSENVTGVGASRAAAIVEYANKLAGNEEEE